MNPHSLDANADSPFDTSRWNDFSLPLRSAVVFLLTPLPFFGMPLSPLQAQPVPVNPPTIDRICVSEACKRSTPTSPLPLYWLPPSKCLPPSSSPIPYTVPMRVPANGSTFGGKRVPNILTIVNANPATRTLQLNGSASKDLMVGTPDVSDVLSGAAGGGDTFVVGGSSELVNYESGTDQIIVNIPSSGERDRVVLTAAGGRQQEIIYISTALERNGGRFALSPATSGTPYWSEVNVLGASSLQSVPLPPATPADCVSGAMGGPAMVVARASSPLPAAGKPVEATTPANPPAKEDTASACDKPCACPLTGGAPVLENFQAGASDGQGENPDQIVLALDEFRHPFFNADHYLFGGSTQELPIPIYEVSDVSISSPPARGFFPQQQSMVEAQSSSRATKFGPGISQKKVPTDKYAFFYFTNSGLLVFSQNAKPLASGLNPGRVIAQLLNQDCQPTKLPTSAKSTNTKDPVYEARFLSFARESPGEFTDNVRPSRRATP